MEVDEGIGWRSLLFVPGSRPDRFDKALAAGADAVCVDLEDAVTRSQKDQARTAALAFLAESSGRPQRVVRINSPRSLIGMRDLLAIVESGVSGGAVAIPKVESAEELSWIDQLLTEAGLDLALVPQVETLRGVENAPAIARASRRSVAIMFGGLDLAAEIGAPASWEALFYGRSRVVHAAAQAGLAVIDMPFVDVRDPDGCRAEAERALRLGFTAKMAIHPSQVAVINETWTPSPEEVAQAERIAQALAEAPDGVLLLDGKMVERPVVRSMQRILARARAAAASGS